MVQFAAAWSAIVVGGLLFYFARCHRSEGTRSADPGGSGIGSPADADQQRSRGLQDRERQARVGRSRIAQRRCGCSRSVHAARRGAAQRPSAFRRTRRHRQWAGRERSDPADRSAAQVHAFAAVGSPLAILRRRLHGVAMVDPRLGTERAARSDAAVAPFSSASAPSRDRPSAWRADRRHARRCAPADRLVSADRTQGPKDRSFAS